MEPDQKGSEPLGEEPAPPQPDPSGSDSPGASRREAFESLIGQFEGLFNWATIYVYSRIDAVKLAIRRGIRRGIVLGIIAAVALVAAASMTVMAGVLLCLGVSDSLAALFGHRWAGELATGVLILGGMSLASYIALRSMVRASMRRTVEKYEAMQTGRPGNGKSHG